MGKRFNGGRERKRGSVVERDLRTLEGTDRPSQAQGDVSLSKIKQVVGKRVL